MNTKKLSIDILNWDPRLDSIKPKQSRKAKRRVSKKIRSCLKNQLQIYKEK